MSEYRQYQNPRWLQDAVESAKARLDRACEEGNIDEIIWAKEELDELKEYERFAWADEEADEMEDYQ